MLLFVDITRKIQWTLLCSKGSVAQRRRNYRGNIRGSIFLHDISIIILLKVKLICRYENDVPKISVKFKFTPVCTSDVRVIYEDGTDQEYPARNVLSQSVPESLGSLTTESNFWRTREISKFILDLGGTCERHSVHLGKEEILQIINYHISMFTGRIVVSSNICKILK